MVDRAVPRTPVVGLFVLAVIYTLYIAQAVLVPVLIAIVLRAPVSLLARIGVPQALSAGLIVLLVLGVLAFGMKQLAGPAIEWLNRSPLIMRQIELKLGALLESIEAATEVTERFSEMAALGGNGAPEDGETVVVEGPSLAAQIFAGTQSLAINVFIIFVLLFFLLAWGAPLREHIIEAFPRPTDSARFETLLRGIGSDIGGYLRTITVINVVLGVIVGGVMALLGLPEPALWGVLAALLNFMPYIGPIVTVGILSVVSLLTFYSWTDILLPPLAYIAINTVEGYLVTPAVVGRRLILNPIMVFVSVMFWGWLWGMAGALLAVPILAAFKVVCEHYEGLNRVKPVLE